MLDLQINDDVSQCETSLMKLIYCYHYSKDLSALQTLPFLHMDKPQNIGSMVFLTYK